MYTEMEWIKTDSANDDSAPADAKSAQALKMNGSEWQDSVAKLAAQFGSTKHGRARLACQRRLADEAADASTRQGSYSESAAARQTR